TKETPPPPEPDHGKREAIRKRIETMKLWGLMEELQLSETEALELFPKVRDFDRQEQERHRKERRLFRQLKAELHKRSVDEGRLREIIDELARLREAGFTAERKHIEAMSRLLSTEQLARYIVFNMEFRDRIHRLIRKARGRGHPGRPKGPASERHSPLPELPEEPL
ncbi:MAG: hypothetical protein D6812_13600, partial [Deltaproteobacteria bacterium]